MSQRSKPVSLPDLQFLRFDPTADAAGKKKGAAGEAVRPVGETMQQLTIDRPIQGSIGTMVTVGKDPVVIEREYRKASAWLEPRLARGRKEIFSEEATITPLVADLLLKANPDNRALKRTRLSEIKADLENGNWVFNGEAIIVSRDGLLNDGQHRLIAVRDTGIPMKTLMVFGVSRSSRLTLDQGTARTSADYLSMQGRDDEAKVVAATARMIWVYEKTGGLITGGTKSDKQRRRQPTKSEIVGVATDRELSIRHSIGCVPAGWRLVGSKSFVVFCHWVFSRTDDVAATQFIEKLVEGLNLTVDSPIYILRQRLLSDTKMRTEYRFEAVVRAWNAMRRGQTVSKIQVMGRMPKVEG